MGPSDAKSEAAALYKQLQEEKGITKEQIAALNLSEDLRGKFANALVSHRGDVSYKNDAIREFAEALVEQQPDAEDFYRENLEKLVSDQSDYYDFVMFPDIIGEEERRKLSE